MELRFTIFNILTFLAIFYHADKLRVQVGAQTTGLPPSPPGPLPPAPVTGYGPPSPVNTPGPPSLGNPPGTPSRSPVGPPSGGNPPGATCQPLPPGALPPCQPSASAPGAPYPVGPPTAPPSAGQPGLPPSPPGQLPPAPVSGYGPPSPVNSPGPPSWDNAPGPPSPYPVGPPTEPPSASFPGQAGLPPSPPSPLPPAPGMSYGPPSPVNSPASPSLGNPVGPPTGGNPPGATCQPLPPGALPPCQPSGASTPGPSSGSNTPGSPSGGKPPGAPSPPGIPSPTTPSSGGSYTPTRAPLVSFLKRSLYRDCRPDGTSHVDYLGLEWDKQIELLKENIVTGGTFYQRYSCWNRCRSSDRAAEYPLSPYTPRCYCDDLCQIFGDCCYDFYALCKQGGSRPLNSKTESSGETCIVFENSKTKAKYHGYAVWSTCPANWTDDNIRRKCQHENRADFLSSLPVFDEDTHVTYRNTFCARCNRALNTKYWNVKVVCPNANTTNLNFSNILDLAREKNCYFAKNPPSYQLFFLKRCIPQYEDCSEIAPTDNETACQGECLTYALPVCNEGRNKKLLFKNPQCALCNGYRPTSLETNCHSGTAPVSPSLTVLFDFQSTSAFYVSYEDRDRVLLKFSAKQLSCLADEVYDPYMAKCKPVASPILPSAHQGTTQNNTETQLHVNCSVIAFNKSEYVYYPNGTVFLKPHGKMYPNTTFVISGSDLLLCVNFTRNFTKTKKERGHRLQIRLIPASLQYLTSIGAILSFVSLILLLLTYILFPELRNLPGKIVINLASSLLMYQLFFFLAVDTSNKVRCLAVAVLLHFFTLSSFAWMNVMAFDIHRVFTAEVGVATTQGGQTKRLLKYSLYSWGTAMVIVITCFVLDHVKEGSVGYGRGEQECFISTSQAKLYSMVLPVAVLMLLNIFALGHTLFHMCKTRKVTQQVTNQRPGSSMTLISIKMVSVMGVTWLLGVAANVKALWFLWYPFVVLNSLQGFFIFLSFAASGKALELYKGKLRKILPVKKEVSGQTNSSTDAANAKSNKQLQDSRL